MSKVNPKWERQEEELADVLQSRLRCLSRFVTIKTASLVKTIQEESWDEYGKASKTIGRRLRGAVKRLQERGTPIGNLGDGFRWLYGPEVGLCRQALRKTALGILRRSAGLGKVSLKEEVRELLNVVGG